jgi:putative phosphoribosyl transferase
MEMKPRFRDRADAGQWLAEVLGDRTAVIVLALPRGGVPVAHEIARLLDAPLDILLVGKIGVPGYPEYAIGAVVDGKNPQRVINEDVLAYSGASPAYVEAQAVRELAEIERRRKVYLGERSPLCLKGRDVILVDDGIATGASVRAGLQALKQVGAARVTLAVPVAPKTVLEELRDEVDEIVCLHAPEHLRAVSLEYENFDQTSDGEVIELLNSHVKKRHSVDNDCNDDHDAGERPAHVDTLHGEMVFAVHRNLMRDFEQVRIAWNENCSAKHQGQ